MKKIYLLICKIYSLVFTLIENILYKKKKVDKRLFHKFSEIELNRINFENFKIISENEYLDKIIFPKDAIMRIINNLFISNKLMQKITEITGYEYCVSFFTAYKIYKLNEKDINKNLYANLFHTDKPYSENMLKIIFSFDSITEQMGPMEIIDNNNEVIKTCLNFSEVFIFHPNLLSHRATSPQNGERFQMMLQLNPSTKWQINNQIFKKQKFREPKFPFFSYFFDKKINLIYKKEIIL